MRGLGSMLWDLALPEKSPLPQVVACWNGLAISAFATAARVLRLDAHTQKAFPSDAKDPADYLAAAEKVRLPNSGCGMPVYTWCMLGAVRS